MKTRKRFSRLSVVFALALLASLLALPASADHAADHTAAQAELEAALAANVTWQTERDAYDALVAAADDATDAQGDCVGDPATIAVCEALLAELAAATDPGDDPPFSELEIADLEAAVTATADTEPTITVCLLATGELVTIVEFELDAELHAGADHEACDSTNGNGDNGNGGNGGDNGGDNGTDNGGDNGDTDSDVTGTDNGVTDTGGTDTGVTGLGTGTSDLPGELATGPGVSTVLPTELATGYGTSVLPWAMYLMVLFGLTVGGASFALRIRQ